MAVPTTVDDFAVTPSVPMYCRTTGATTDAEPARARPNPSSNVFLPSATTSSGTSSYLVPVMNSATYRVRPGACASSSPAAAAAASADGRMVNPARARGVLKKSRRIILRAFVVLPLPYLVHEDFRILVALVTGELPELVIRQSSLRDAHGPGTREHRRVRDRRLIVQRVRVDVFSQRGRPWLIRDMAVGRIHDEARVALDDAGNALIELLCAAQRRIERMRAAADGTPRAFHVRLSVGRLRRRPRPVPSLVEGPGGGRPGLALTGERHRQR